MPKPREQQISLEATPYYHCVSRCVRRAFLCGTDHQSGQCYEHRRGWLEDKLLSLPQIFAIDIAAYAIMSNHYHAVFFIDDKRAKGWTGRILRHDKRGAISRNTESILTRLGIDDSQWLEMTEHFEDCFRTFAGGEQSLRTACETLRYQRPPGLSRCRSAIG